MGYGALITRQTWKLRERRPFSFDQEKAVSTMNMTAGNMAAIPNAAPFVCDAWENRGTMVFVLWVLSTLGFSIAFFFFGQQALAQRSRRLNGADAVLEVLRKIEPLLGGKIKGLGKCRERAWIEGYWGLLLLPRASCCEITLRF